MNMRSCRSGRSGGERSLFDERFLRLSLLLALLLCLLARAFGHDRLSDWLWIGATVLIVITLAVRLCAIFLLSVVGTHR